MKIINGGEVEGSKVTRSHKSWLSLWSHSLILNEKSVKLRDLIMVEFEGMVEFQKMVDSYRFLKEQSSKYF